MTIDDLKKMDLKDLKALAYDTIIRIEQEQQNVRVINSIISEKSNSVQGVQDVGK